MQMVLTKSLVSEDNPLEQRMVKEVWFFTGAETRTKIDEREQRQREGDKPAPISHQPEVQLSSTEWPVWELPEGKLQSQLPSESSALNLIILLHPALTAKINTIPDHLYTPSLHRTIYKEKKKTHLVLADQMDEHSKEE